VLNGTRCATWLEYGDSISLLTMLLGQFHNRRQNELAAASKVSVPRTGNNKALVYTKRWKGFKGTWYRMTSLQNDMNSYIRRCGPWFPKNGSPWTSATRSPAWAGAPC